MLKSEELKIYGKFLDGTETELEKFKLLKILFIKKKMREFLSSEIGDSPDNITDVLRVVIFSQAIQNGTITDSNMIERFNNYINTMLIGYGGGEEILNVLENNIQHIAYHVNNKYFVAKNQILSANTIDDILKIDPYSENVDEEIV
jgi:hypothetical protein